MDRLVRITAVLIFLLAVLACGPSFSYTLVTGEVGGQTWTAAQSPYRLSGEVSVSMASTLTIEAGVTVECERNARLHVYGTLLAQGTPEGIITFTSTRGASSAWSDWNSIYLDGSSTDNSLIKYCNIKFAVNGIYLPFSSATVTNCLLENNNYSINVTGRCKPSILNSTLRNSARGINVFHPGGAGNDPKPIIKYNLISQNAYGIYLSTAFPDIFGNTIANNTVYGIYGTGSSPRINFNNIENNAAGVWSDAGVDGTKNWWGHSGAPSPPEVNEHILCTEHLSAPVQNRPPSSVNWVGLKANRNFDTDFAGDLGIPDIMFIQVSGEDASAESYNWATVIITNEYSGVAAEREIAVDLMETGKNTGIYRGTAWTAGVAEGNISSYHDKSRGFIRALPNDKFKMASVDGGPSFIFFPTNAARWKPVNNPIRLVAVGFYVPNNRQAADDPERTTLIIEPGVTVEAFYGSVIYPTVASGEMSRRIVLTTADPSPEVGNGWSGLYLLGGNTVRFCDIKYAATGMYIHYQPDIVEYCNVMYCINGISCGYQNPKFFKNNIKWNRDYGVVAGSYSVLGRYNNIVGNGSGWRNSNFASPGCQDDASENYWGASDGPTRESHGSGNGVGVRVAYTPWLSAEVDFGPPPALSGFGLFLDRDCAIPAADVGLLDNFYIRATGGAGDTGKINITRARVRRSGSATSEIVCDLLETGPNTGIYLATVRVTGAENDGYKRHVMALAGDLLTISLPDNGLVAEQPLNVTRTARWRKESNPNRILGGDTQLIVYPGYRLVIDPGVVVQSSTRYVPAYYPLLIYGTLEALGSPESRIVFTSTVPDPLPGDWGWLYFLPASAAPTASTLKNCDILYSQGIRCENFTVTIEGCRVGSSETGVYLVGTVYPSRSVIRNNEIYNSTVCGMQCLSSGVPFIEKNYIHDNPSGVNVSSAGPLIRTNTIESNNVSGAAGQGGIVFVAAGNSTPEVWDNSLKNNRRNIVVLGGWNKNMPVIHYNNIFNDPGYGEAGVEKYPAESPTVDATFNYWGGPNGPKHPVTNPLGNPYSTVTNFVSYETYLTVEASRGGPVATQESPPNAGATNNRKTDISVKVIAPLGLDLVHVPPVLSVNGTKHTYPDGGKLTFEAISSRLIYTTADAYAVGTLEVSLDSAYNVIGIELQNKPYVWRFIVDDVSPEIVGISAEPSVARVGTVTVTVEVYDGLSGINYTRPPTVELEYPGGTKKVTRSYFSGGRWVGTVEVTPSVGNGWASIEVYPVFDLAGNLSSSTREENALFIDTISPEVTVYKPSGGEEFSWSRKFLITWEAEDPPPTLGLPQRPISLYYTTGEGMPLILITSEVENTGSFQWTVPSVVSSQCSVIAEAVDHAGNRGRGKSAGDFSIVPINPYVVSTRPIDGAIKIPVDRTITYIEVTFSKTMDADSVNAISISPEAAGYPLLLSNKLLYMFSEDLKNYVSYEVKISGEAKDLEGNPILDAPYVFHFLTVPLDVTPPVIGPVEFDGRTYSPTPPNNIMARAPQIRAMITDEAGGSGVDPTSIRIYIDGQVFMPTGYMYDEVTHWLTYNVSTEFSVGNYVVTIEARDRVGNTGTWEAGVVVKPGPTIDRVRFDGRLYMRGDIISSKPSIEARILDESGSSETVQPSSIKVKAGPNVLSPGASVYDFGTGMMNYNMRKEPVALGPGTYTVTIEARDIYGNLGRWEGYDLRVMAGRTQVIGPMLAYPSPFSPLKGQRLRVAYTLSVADDITIYLYDISGQVVLTKKFSADGPGGLAGYNDFLWDGKTDFGKIVANGIFIVKIVAKGRAVGTGKIVVMD